MEQDPLSGPEQRQTDEHGQHPQGSHRSQIDRPAFAGASGNVWRCSNRRTGPAAKPTPPHTSPNRGCVNSKTASNMVARQMQMSPATSTRYCTGLTARHATGTVSCAAPSLVSARRAVLFLEWPRRHAAGRAGAAGPWGSVVSIGAFQSTPPTNTRVDRVSLTRSISMFSHFRTGGRAVEGTRLESV